MHTALCIVFDKVTPLVKGIQAASRPLTLGCYLVKTKHMKTTNNNIDEQDIDDLVLQAISHIENNTRYNEIAQRLNWKQRSKIYQRIARHCANQIYFESTYMKTKEEKGL